MFRAVHATCRTPHYNRAQDECSQRTRATQETHTNIRKENMHHVRRIVEQLGWLGAPPTLPVRHAGDMPDSLPDVRCWEGTGRNATRSESPLVARVCAFVRAHTMEIARPPINMSCAVSDGGQRAENGADGMVGGSRGALWVEVGESLGNFGCESVLVKLTYLIICKKYANMLSVGLFVQSIDRRRTITFV